MLVFEKKGWSFCKVGRKNRSRWCSEAWTLRSWEPLANAPRGASLTSLKKEAYWHQTLLDQTPARCLGIQRAKSEERQASGKSRSPLLTAEQPGKKGHVISRKTWGAGREGKAERKPGERDPSPLSYSVT